VKTFSFINHLQSENVFETKVNCFQNEAVFIYKSFEILKMFVFFLLLKKCQKEEIFRVACMGPNTHPLIFPFIPWNEYTIKMSCDELTGNSKTNREESLTKHVGFVYAYAKKAKNRQINDVKGGDEQENQEL